jgi:NADP-dependent 3-hydroxy acid dehydrogenase YdfG/Tfp pilus assembly protein PilF
MNNPHFVVLFHQVNFPLAVAMTRDLVHAGFTFSLLCEDDLAGGETIAARLRADQRPLILMVSDNFLKTAACVHQLLPALRERDPLSVQIIVLTEGQSGNDTAPSPTRLDRVGQILHYINHWQDRYLKLRKRQAEQPEASDAFEQELRWTRQIAFDIGNLIEYFREHSAYAWEAFTANHYELFFRKSANISLHEDYRRGFPYAEDDREIEDRLQEELQRIREATALQKDDPDREEAMIRAILQEGEQPAQEQGLTPEKDLLTRLIAYKNGLGHDETVLDDRDMPDQPEEDEEDWDEEEADAPDTDDLGAEIVALPARDLAGLRRLVAADPENVSARLELAALLARDETHFNETTTHLEEVLRHDPRNARAFLLLGELSQQYREYKLAQRYFEKALESEPGMGQAHYALARLLERDPGTRDEALHHLSEARKCLPERADIWSDYAKALAEAGQTRKAIKALKRALKLDPDNEALRSRLAELYFASGDRIKALRYYREIEEDEIPDTKVKPETPVPALKEVPQTPMETHAPAGARESEPTATRPSRVLTVLITGATSGIGRATARLFAERGHRLILTGRREDRLSALQAELEQRFHATVFPLAFDIRQEAVTRQLVRALPPEWAAIDVLINNAGLAKGLAPIHEGNIEHWDTMIDTNIKGLLYMTRAVAPGMVERRRGHIINICSTAGKEVYPKGNVYCATKFAVDALTRGIRQDLVPYNIRVGQVSPGHVEETEFALNRFDGDSERARIYEDFNPLTSRDVAEAIWWMINQPAHVNIQDILLTGTQQAASTLIERSGRIFDRNEE